MTSVTSPESQQGIHKMTVTKNGEMFEYNVNGIILKKSNGNGFYTLPSIASLIGATVELLARFINSGRFMFCIRNYDPSFELRQYVYFIEYDGFVKIGMTVNMERRYPLKDVEDKVRRVVPVRIVSNVEAKLKSEFAKKFRYYSPHSKERFIVNDVEEGLKLFDDTVRPYLINEIQNPHVKKFDKDKTYGNCVLISPIAASILIALYSKRDYLEAKSIIDTVEAAYERININDFIAVVRINGSNIQYWKYRGYVIIINRDDKTVNISRLWKTVSKVIRKPGQRKIQMKDFVNSAPIRRLLSESSTEIVKRQYPEMPLLNGKWAPLFFIHLVIQYLSVKYNINTSALISGLILDRILDISPTSITGGALMNDNEGTNIIKEYIRMSFSGLVRN